MLDHFGSAVADAERSRAFYDPALAQLGRSLQTSMLAEEKGGPGIRPQYGPNYYAAFVFDPDGVNLEAVSHQPE